MARKPGSMYREVKGPAYTRREFMGGVPGTKITLFDMGNPQGNYPCVFNLVAREACQIRHSALESSRVAANKLLLRDIGREDFYMKVRVYPHHVLREHKYATGAGADRVSEGMRLAFGKPVGTAARVKAGQVVMTVAVGPTHIALAKEALRRASHKISTPCRIVMEQVPGGARAAVPPGAAEAGAN
ncbi:MAG: 50S ribosomal protein L16 [Halobacteria archaeon]